MGNLWLKIKIWTKVVLFAVVLGYVLFFLYNNSGAENHFTLWIWFKHPLLDRPTLWYLFFAFLAGVVMTILVRTIWKTVSQVREVRRRNRQAKLERDIADMKEKASRLQTRPPVSDAEAP
jgi:hypothetical protein